MELLDPALSWLIVGVMLLFLEMAVPVFVLVFFGLGALLTGAVAWFVDITIVNQLILFLVSSLVLLFALRNVIQRRFFFKKQSPESETTRPDEDLPLVVAGDKGVVVMNIIPPGEGRIKYGGSFWRATADERIDEGEIIAIVGQNGLIIHVEKV